MSGVLSSAPDAAPGRIGEIVPPEVLALPTANERRGLLRDECAVVLDGFLRRLARQEALCRRVLGGIAAAFLARRAHHRLGFARLGDYARERLGVSSRELQSLAQVVAATAALPKIAEAFGRGEVSWAQLRLLATRATPETEDRWLSLVRGRTVRALESCRARPGDAVAEAREADPDDTEDPSIAGEPAARLRIACPRRVSASWRRALELARRMAGEDLAAWQAAEAIAAEGLSGAEPHPDGDGGSVAAAAAADGPARRRDGASVDAEAPQDFAAIDWSAVGEAIPRAVQDLLVGIDAADAFALDERMRAVVRSMQRVDWQLGRLLRLFVDMKLPEALGFGAASRYVRERLGMSARKGRALVHLERRAAKVPELAAAYRHGEISWVRALALLPVVGEGHGADWVERARSVTVRRLIDEVDWAVETRDAAEVPRPVAPPPQGAALARPERQTCAREERPAVDGEIAFSGPASVVSLFRAAVAAFAGPPEPAWRGLERLLDHVTREWARQPRHRDPVFARDGWRCAVPACSSRRNLHDHHVLFRSRGGDNARDNRIAVCAWHHLRGLHSGSVRARGRAPAGIVWEIGVGRGRPPLLRLHGERYASGPLASAPAAR